MEIYCYKCRKKTASRESEAVRTVNKRWRMKAKCVECGNEKSVFIKAPSHAAANTKKKNTK